MTAIGRVWEPIAMWRSSEKPGDRDLQNLRQARGTHARSARQGGLMMRVIAHFLLGVFALGGAAAICCLFFISFGNGSRKGNWWEGVWPW